MSPCEQGTAGIQGTHRHKSRWGVGRISAHPSYLTLLFSILLCVDFQFSKLFQTIRTWRWKCLVMTLFLSMSSFIFVQTIQSKLIRDFEVDLLPYRFQFHQQLHLQLHCHRYLQIKTKDRCKLKYDHKIKLWYSLLNINMTRIFKSSTHYMIRIF